MSTVVAQQYDISGNGGRKLVRLNDGALIAVTKQSPNYFLYKSIDNGNSWTRIYHNSLDSVQGVSIATDGVNIHLLITYNYNSVICYVFDSSGAMKNGLALATETSVGECSLATNEDGTELHAAWASKNTTYPNSFNIRYAKGAINGDGSVTWGAVEQVSKANTSGLNYQDPTIVHNGIEPIIIISHKATNPNRILILKKTGLSVYNEFNWTYNIIHSGDLYAQSAPSAVIDKNGVIHVAWHNAIGSGVNLMVASSIDGGITWSTPTMLVQGNSTTHGRFPSITTDSSGDVYILFDYWNNSTSDVGLVKRTNGSWGAPSIVVDTAITIVGRNPSALYDPTFSIQFADTPPFMYVDSTKKSIEYTGEYALNGEVLYPDRVVGALYSTEGNGGRKLVKLSNGWLVAAVINNVTAPYRIPFYVKKNNGQWENLCHLNFDSARIADIALVSKGTNVYFITANKTTIVYHGSFDALTVNNNVTVPGTTTLDSSQTEIGKLSLAINAQGTEIHGVWASKNATYPNSFNIRYAKGTINGDGTVTWGVVEQVTRRKDITGFRNPTITVHKGNARILVDHEATSSENKNIVVFGKDLGHLWETSQYSDWGNIRVYNGGSYAQSSPSTVVDKDGVIHVAWHGLESGTSTNLIKYAKSLDGGLSWQVFTLTNKGTHGATAHAYPTITVDKNGKLFILYYLYASGSVFKLVNGGTSWATPMLVANTLVNSAPYPSALYDPTFTGSFGDTPPLIYMDGAKQQVTYAGTYSTNTAPNASLVSPTNNQILYENDVINISGEAYDANKDQSVTVFYQINSEQRKVLAINASLTQITLSKQLMFKSGKIYDGEVALTGTLAEGVAHTLKVWAVDSENGQSATIERTFYVIPNRAPLISIDAVVPSGIVNTDKFKISGTASDQDANSSVKVNYRINGTNPIEIFDGAGGAWEFEVSLGQLKVGENLIVVEVIDNYNAKTSRTIKLNKKEVKTPILQSVARYKIEPPKGSAKGVLLFVERDEALDLKVELSMTVTGEQEQYVTLIPVNTAPTNNDTIEDTFEHTVLEEKQNIILKITQSRTDLTFNHKIHLISGAVD